MVKGPEFTVGKQYIFDCQYEHPLNDQIVDCVYTFVGNEYHCMIAVWKDKNGKIHHEKFSGDNWKEYHPPVVVKDQRKVYLRGTSISTGRIDGRHTNSTVGIVEFTVTDGVLTDAKVIRDEEEI